MKILPVIMAGGHGTRLWPLSRENFPKQFIKIFDSKSLLQLCLLRNSKLGTPIIIVGPEHRFIAQEQAREVGIDPEIIIEPMSKNTAPCGLIASYMMKKKSYDAALLIPADHYILDDEQYISDIMESAPLLHKYDIITLGVKPTSPNTGYGYIERGEQIAPHFFKVKNFTEKPNEEKAIEYIAQGDYYWNSGIFLFGAAMEQISDLLEPEMKNLVEKSIKNASHDLGFLRLEDESYGSIKPNSLDYAIIEKAKNMALKESSFFWADLGSFASIWQVAEKDEMGNVAKGDIETLNASDNYIYSENKLTVAAGVSNLVIINTLDSTLVTSKDKAEEIKFVVNHLNKQNRIEVKHSLKSYRPWGTYQVIDEGPKHKVKRIIVSQGMSLSLQYHEKRAEHWVIVQGVAEVQIGDEMKILQENDSVYVPKLVKHRLRNVGEVPLHLIEVQTGDYLEEDDIVRLSDNYGRK
ncbi:MAG: mannose-1-phosphate guanylyltransferase/mannose-6-phosphate isomerase [Rickettsiaceae bacterium]|nr:mannose-1-phosphate guanylyltransferase/mannose-6-phosphate isomerase [Rickettsiaceae bacterium]